MAQRFDDLLSPRKRRRGSSEIATLLVSLDTPAAIILLHPAKVVPKVWYFVGIDLIEAPTTSQNGNRFFLSRRCKTRGGGALGYFLGGYVPPGTPNWHLVLKKISRKIDTPF